MMAVAGLRQSGKAQRWSRWRQLLLGALLPLVPTESVAQGPLQVLAFTDTSSVRIEVEVPNAATLVGAAVNATIVNETDSTHLWSGELGQLAVAEGDVGRLTARLEGLDPLRWSPESPHLYRLTVEVAHASTTLRSTARIGFRRFEVRDGRFLLNGRPVFLKGNSINPPDRTLPDSLDENPRFAREYLQALKRSGVNIIRLTRHSQVWFDVADEVGMLIFQGHYGTPEGGGATYPPRQPLEQSLQWYREEVFEPLVNHPSVVIYVLSNEQAAPEISYKSRGHEEIERFLTNVYRELRRWDDTRPYIGNAGYGFGRSGDVCDLHRYWGWYYNSFLSYYTLRDPHVCWRSDRVQPITLTEAVGNYTGVDGRFNLVSRSKQPDSQLNWTGHAPDSEQAERGLAHQALVAKQAIEITRRLRARNPYLAGIMPFSIPFYRWWGIRSFAEMGSKPVLDQFAVSYQPVLLSWELWTPQVYAGSTLRPVAHVVNDAESGEGLDDLVLHYALVDSAGTKRAEGRLPFPDVAYYQAVGTRLEIRLPEDLPTGEYMLRGRLERNAEVISRNETPIFVAGRDFVGEPARIDRTVVLYDPRGATGAALRNLGVPFRVASDLAGLDPEADLLVIGAEAWDETLADSAEALRAFVDEGGRAIVLRQSADRFDPSWLPTAVRLQTEELDHPLVYPGGRPFRNALAVNPERLDHPVFDGIDRDRLYLWSDYTGWDEGRPGFPAVYPVTSGFVLTDRDHLAHTAVLANYDHGLEGVALVEMFSGEGSVILSGFDLVNRSGIDPVADRLLANLIRYQGTNEPHFVHPLVTEKIVWGEYGSERGLVTGIYNGLLLNTVPEIPEGLRDKYPLRIDDEGFHFAGAAGGWNTRPAIQYVPRGRRPFGPYEFTLGGAVRLPDGAGAVGEGRVWLRLPEDRSRMVTTVWNPADVPLEIEIEVNGTRQPARIAAGATVEVETPLPRASRSLALVYRGDRRLVLLATDFQ